MCHHLLFSKYNVHCAQPLQVFDIEKLCKLAFRARECEYCCPPAWCCGYGESSLMLMEGTWGSDLPLTEPWHEAGHHLQLVWFVKLGREILGDGHLQHLIHIWGRVLKNLVKEKKKIVQFLLIIQLFYMLFMVRLLYNGCLYIVFLHRIFNKSLWPTLVKVGSGFVGFAVHSFLLVFWEVHSR